MSISTANISDTTGIRIPKGACVVLVRTDWNSPIVDELEKGCLAVLAENQVNHTVVRVPGAFEIPFAIKNYWDGHKYTDQKPSAFIALGCIIKGDTPHFDYVCKGITDGIMQLNLSIPVPSIFGVLTVNTREQALERLGGVHGHKGREAAATALKMISMVQEHCTRKPKTRKS